jgi:hypothetical protein
MSVLVFFLEEPSAKAMLKGLLPRILPTEWLVRYVVFAGYTCQSVPGTQEIDHKQISKSKRLPGDWHSPFHRKQSFPKFQKIHFRGEKYCDGIRMKLKLKRGDGP